MFSLHLSDSSVGGDLRRIFLRWLETVVLMCAAIFRLHAYYPQQPRCTNVGSNAPKSCPISSAMDHGRRRVKSRGWPRRRWILAWLLQSTAVVTFFLSFSNFLLGPSWNTMLHMLKSTHREHHMPGVHTSAFDNKAKERGLLSQQPVGGLWSFMNY